MKLQSNRPGFALPLALLVIGFLTVSVATAFTRIDVENRGNRNRDAEAEAFALAQSGLERFAADRTRLATVGGSASFTSVPPAVMESARITLPGGYADVIMRRVRAKTPTTEAIYAINSRGVHLAGGMSWTPPAVRSVGQYAYFREGTVGAPAAWTSLSGIVKNGGAGTIAGADACAGTGLATNGVAVPTTVGTGTPPDSGYIQTGGSLVPTGSPDDVHHMGTETQMASQIDIDWDGIRDGNAMPADVQLGLWPQTGFNSDPNWWPVLRADGNYSLAGGSTGRGILIVTGDLELNGDATFRGVILIGGKATSNGNNNVQGAIVSGLNVMLGENVDQSAIANGNKFFHFHSCDIAQALQAYSRVVLIPNTWVDNWPIW